MNKEDFDRVRHLLVEAVTTLCRSGVHYDNALKVEGLIGITVDENQVFLINFDKNFTTVSETCEGVGDSSTNNLTPSSKRKRTSDCKNSPFKRRQIHHDHNVEETPCKRNANIEICKETDQTLKQNTDSQMTRCDNRANYSGDVNRELIPCVYNDEDSTMPLETLEDDNPVIVKIENSINLDEDNVNYMHDESVSSYTDNPEVSTDAYTPVCFIPTAPPIPQTLISTDWPTYDRTASNSAMTSSKERVRRHRERNKKAISIGLACRHCDICPVKMNQILQEKRYGANKTKDALAVGLSCSHCDTCRELMTETLGRHRKAASSRWLHKGH